MKKIIFLTVMLSVNINFITAQNTYTVNFYNGASCKVTAKVQQYTSDYEVNIILLKNTMKKPTIWFYKEKLDGSWTDPGSGIAFDYKNSKIESTFYLFKSKYTGRFTFIIYDAASGKKTGYDFDTNWDTYSCK